MAVVIGLVYASQNLAQSRNAQRKADLNAISHAIELYALEHRTNYPEEITQTKTEICRAGASSCAGMINLALLTKLGNKKEPYLLLMPSDPTGASDQGSGYYVHLQENRIIFSAPYAELDEKINVSR